MSKKVKNLMEQEYKSHFDGINECMVVSLRGVNGVDNNAVRGDLLSKNIHINMIKNSLARRAFASVGMEGVKDVLVGPCAIAYGGESIVDVAKEIVGWAKKLENIEIKGGFVEGEVLDSQAAVELSKLPSRAELQGAAVNLAQSPGSRLAGAIISPAGNIAGCIKTLVEKLEESQAA